MYALQTKKASKTHSKTILTKHLPNTIIQRITIFDTAWNPEMRVRKFTDKQKTDIETQYNIASRKLDTLCADVRYNKYQFLNDMRVNVFNDQTIIYPLSGGNKAQSTPLGSNEISLDPTQHHDSRDYRISLYHEGFHIACGGRVDDEMYIPTPRTKEAKDNLNEHVTIFNKQEQVCFRDGSTALGYPKLNPDTVAFWIDTR